MEDKENSGFQKSAKEELSEFKQLPVVGKMPWKSQSLVLSGILGVSVVSMTIIGFKGEAPTPSKVVSASSLIHKNLNAAEGIGSFDLAALRSTVNAASERGVSVSPEDWKVLTDSLNKIVEIVENNDGVFGELNAASQILMDAKVRALVSFRSSSAMESLSKEEMTAFLNVINGFGDMSSFLKSKSWSDDDYVIFNESLTQTLASLRTNQRSNSALAAVWTDLSKSYSESAEALGKVKDLAPMRSQISALSADARDALGKVISADQLSKSGGGYPISLIFFAILAILSLLMLVLSAMKQTKWQSLNGLEYREANEQAIFDLMEDIEAIMRGDLTKRAKVSETPIGTLADSINGIVEKWRQSSNQYKKIIRDLDVATSNLNEVKESIVNTQQDNIEKIHESSQDSLRIVEMSNIIPNELSQTSNMLTSMGSSVMLGMNSSNGGMNSNSEIKIKIEELGSRVQRIVDLNFEIESFSNIMKEIAEQMEILGLQAELYAEQAGDHAGGVKVVAKSIQELSSDSNQKAKSIKLLSETAKSDLESLNSAMKDMVAQAESGKKSAYENIEAWSSVDEKINKVVGALENIWSYSKEQANLSYVLDLKTRGEIEMAGKVELQIKEVNESASSLLSVVDSLKELNSRYKS